jgi:hypothetical protein
MAASFPASARPARTGRRQDALVLLEDVKGPDAKIDWDGQWYLVSMLGEDCNWVQNVRAAGGRVVLRRRAVACQLAEVPAAGRPVIIRRYLQKVPDGRPHIPVSKDAPLSELISPRYRVIPLDGGSPARSVPATRDTGAGRGRYQMTGHAGVGRRGRHASPRRASRAWLADRDHGHPAGRLTAL